LLLLLGEWVATLVRAGGWTRLAGAAGLLAFTGASLAADLALIGAGRGDVGPAVEALAARAPRGARVLIDGESGLALVKVAAAEAGYPVELATACPAAPFLFADTFPGEPDRLPTVQRCGAAYRAVARGHAVGLSGQNWTLYERVG
jgi:hypothetical protein